MKPLTRISSWRQARGFVLPVSGQDLAMLTADRGNASFHAEGQPTAKRYPTAEVAVSS